MAWWDPVETRFKQGWGDAQNLGYEEFQTQYGVSKQGWYDQILADFEQGFQDKYGHLNQDDPIVQAWYKHAQENRERMFEDPWQSWARIQRHIEVDTDGNGRTDIVVDPLTAETVQDYTNIQRLMDEAEAVNQQLRTFDEWAADQGINLNDITGSDEYAGLSELIDFYESGGMTPEVEQGFIDFISNQLGMAGQDYIDMMGGLQTELAEGVSGQQGLAPDELALRERQIRTETRTAEERARRLLENIHANHGSSARYFMAADSALRQINDQEIASRVALADEVFKRKLADFEGKQRQFEMLLQNNQITMGQYLDVVMQNKATAFSAYAAQVDMMYKENEQYFQRYQQDLAAVQQHINNIYTAINAEMGVNEQIHQMIMDEWGMTLQEWQLQLQEEALALQEQALEMSEGGGFLDGLTQIIGTLVPAVGVGIQAAEYFGWGQDDEEEEP